MSKNDRLYHLKQYFSAEIMGVFSKGIPKELKEVSVSYERGISYEEAYEILEHTISLLKEKPIQF